MVEQEFHEDLCMKNKDVERLTKAPSSNSRLQLHGSAWKLNEMDAMSPRVMTLQNKWRTVWRISVDRKKRLQDMLDQLLEVDLTSFSCLLSILPSIYLSIQSLFIDSVSIQ